MAENILVSPGIAVSELDQSAVAARPLVAGAAILGPTVKGPVNIPTKVTSYLQYVQKFGDTFVASGSTETREFMTSMAAKSYFEQGGDSLLVTRVAPDKGSSFKPAASTAVMASGSFITGSIFELETLSVGEELNSVPTGQTASWTGSVPGVVNDRGVLAQGTADNVRFSISNINEDRGTFSLTIRRGDDTSKDMIVLENYNDLSLDPNSNNFIARVIGNQKTSVKNSNDGVYVAAEGDYVNSSAYVRVKAVNVTTPNYLDAEGNPKSEYTGSLPKVQEGGFNGAEGKVGYYKAEGQPRRDRISGLFEGSTVSGSFIGSFSDNETLAGNASVGTGTATFNGSPTTGSITGSNGTTSFSGSYSTSVSGNAVSGTYSVTYSGSAEAVSGSITGTISTVTPIVDVLETNYFQDIKLSNTHNETVESDDYSVALALMQNQDEYQINILSAPSYHFNGAASAITSVAEERGDCIAVVDVTDFGSDISTTTGAASACNSSYAATYWPWLQMISSTGKLVWVPASVVVPGIYTYTDHQTAPWYAPAGMTRGGVQGVVQTERKLTKGMRDKLYLKNVNPIATLPGAGIVVYGQKTLQKKASALDRVNVRRLLIELKKNIKDMAAGLLFEQNTEALRNSFRGKVEPYLASVVQRNGLYSYKVDLNGNTADAIDRNEFRCTIYLQPTKTIEFVYLDFVVTATGVEFN